MPFPSSSTSQETNGNGNGHGPAKPTFVPIVAPPSLVDKSDDADLGQLLDVLKRRMGAFCGWPPHWSAISLGTPAEPAQEADLDL